MVYREIYKKKNRIDFLFFLKVMRYIKLKILIKYLCIDVLVWLMVIFLGGNILVKFMVRV